MKQGIPTEPGWYWLKCTFRTKPKWEVQQVWQWDDGTLVWGTYAIEFNYPSNDRRSKIWRKDKMIWIGPIPEPEIK